jgi:hypothetical protein
VAHALVRAVFALLRTQGSGIDHSVHMSVNAARRGRAPRGASKAMETPCYATLEKPGRNSNALVVYARGFHLGKNVAP